MAAAIDLCTNWLAVSRIELETYVDNAPAIGLFQKHGFVVEGTAENHAFGDGRMESFRVWHQDIEVPTAGGAARG